MDDGFYHWLQDYGETFEVRGREPCHIRRSQSPGRYFNGSVTCTTEPYSSEEITWHAKTSLVLLGKASLDVSVLYNRYCELHEANWCPSNPAPKDHRPLARYAYKNAMTRVSNAHPIPLAITELRVSP